MKLEHLVGFVIRIYHDARSSECQKTKQLMLFIPDLLGSVMSVKYKSSFQVPDSIPGSTAGIFPEGGNYRGGHGLCRFVELRFKGPPDTTSSCITTHIIGTT